MKRIVGLFLFCLGTPFCAYTDDSICADDVVCGQGEFGGENNFESIIDQEKEGVLVENDDLMIHEGDYTLFSLPADPYGIFSSDQGEVIEFSKRDWLREKIEEVKFCCLIVAIYGNHYVQIAKQRSHHYFCKVKKVFQRLLGSHVVEHLDLECNHEQKA